MRNNLAIAVAGLLHFALVSQAQAAATTLYVAPSGRDAWSGRLAAVNEAKTDGPLATLARAHAAARSLATPVRIVVRAGTYRLNQALVLEPQDSGLTIEAAKGEDAVISGGRVVTGWKPWKGKVLQADLSNLSLPDLKFRELYHHGRLQQWARVPNFDPARPRTGGFLQNAGIVEPNTKTKFQYREGDLHPEKWAHPERAWMMFHDSLNYETQYCPVKSIDPVKRVVEASRGVYVLGRGNPFYLCGVMEELDAPGEWCVDPDTKTLYFWPPSADPEMDEAVVVPALRSAFVLKGDAAGDKWVENVRLAGLAVRDFRGRAIELAGARGCTVAACDLRNAEVGVYLGDDTHACKVLGCDITQTQGDGVSILGTSLDHERVSDHVADNNYIWDFGWGRIHNRCGGVYMHRCARCKLTHNHVHDGPRYGLAMDVGNDCEFAYNYCHHANLVTADTGIIEAATAHDWRMPQDEEIERNRLHNRGNSIHHNLLHDSGGWGTDRRDGTLKSPYYSWGIYLDVACSGWRVHDNVVYNTVLGGFMLNCGLDNVVENNVFVDGKTNQIQWNPWTKYPFHGNRCERNIFYYRGGTAALYTLHRFQDEYCRFESNLIWNPEQKFRIIGLKSVAKRRTWEAWLKRGQDQGTAVADPQFVDPDRRDYRLKPSSPAHKLGFRPIDLSTVGNYASPDRRTWPRPEVKVARDAADYTPPTSLGPQQPARRDYEDYSVGEPERGAHVGQQGSLGTVAVTDETAAEGKHSLKFTDAAGIKHIFVPYVTYPYELEKGLLKAGFDLRLEQGAVFVYEWRDDPYHYNLGPNLSVDAQGWLSANGKRLMQLPHGQWMRFDVSCGLGPQATGKYDLTIRLPGRAAQTLRDVACSPKFEYLNCVVIMSMANGPSMFYVDNVEFKPKDGK